MNAIVIKPKTKDEQDFLTYLLKKMNIDVSIVEELPTGYDTLKAMEDVKKRKGSKVKNSDELFTQLGI